jgi:hypothetical protein
MLYIGLNRFLTNKEISMNKISMNNINNMINIIIKYLK